MVTEIHQDSHRSGFSKGEEIHKPISKRLYSLKEAAGYLGRGLYGVRELVWNEKIPVVRDGRKQFIDILDLDAYIARNKQGYTLRKQDERRMP